MATKEIELAYLCRVTEPKGYEQANATEIHEQWEFRLPPGENGERRGRVRVRKTTQNGETQYAETIKPPISEGNHGDHEETIAITETYFETWKHVFGVTGQAKIRYSYLSQTLKVTVNGQPLTLPPVTFEVDVFLNAAGQRSQFVKVDIEVQDVIAYLETHHPGIKASQFKIDFSQLPLGITDVIDMGSQDAKDQEAVSHFFDTFKLTLSRPEAPQTPTER